MPSHAWQSGGESGTGSPLRLPGVCEADTAEGSQRVEILDSPAHPRAFHAGSGHLCAGAVRVQVKVVENGGLPFAAAGHCQF